MVNLKKIADKLKDKYKNTTIVSEDDGLVDFVSTGNLAFDLISDGGIPFGVMTEFIGFSQSGKSLYCQTILANAQRDYGAIGLYIDREGALTDKRAKELGVDTSNVIKAPPESVPTAVDAFSFVIESILDIRKQDKDIYIVAVIDSIAAFDKDVDLEKADVGRKAKSIKEGLRALFTHIDKKVMVLIVNHFYYNVGVVFGTPKQASGGEGLRYFNTLRIALEDKRKITDPARGNEVIGSWIGIEVIKTRLGPCYRTCYVPFYYTTGVLRLGGYMRLLVDRGYVKPKNKKEFLGFRQVMVKYNDKEFNEYDIEKFIETYPSLLFDHYPEYNQGDKDANEDGEGPIVEPVGEEDNSYTE